MKTPSFLTARVFPPLVDVVVLLLSFIGLAARSWRKWPDTIVDFGAELYVPWRLSLGEELYRDISWKNGPLSQYLNSGLFSLFGTSLSTLLFANLALLIVLTVALHLFFVSLWGRGVGFLLSFSFLFLFAFAQYSLTGNYNYVTPYRHEQVHGLLTAVLSLLVFQRYVREPSPLRSALIGALLAATLLTKAELGLALTLALGAGGLTLFGVRSFERAEKRGILLRDCFCFSFGCVLVLLGAYSFLRYRMSAELSIQGVLGNWPYLFGNPIGKSPFYLAGQGMDAPWENLILLSQKTFLLLLLIGLSLLVERLLRRFSWQGGGLYAACLSSILAFFVLWAFPDSVDWFQLFRPLPLLLFVYCLILARRCLRAREDRQELIRVIPQLVWTIFSLGLLGKILLFARIHNYGFTLAMPGTLLLCGALIFELPQFFRSRGYDGRFTQVLFCGLLGTMIFAFEVRSEFHYHRKTRDLGTGDDRIVSYPNTLRHAGRLLPEILGELQREMEKDSTLIVFPEGSMLNYLLRKRNPTPYLFFVPTDLDAFGGEEQALVELRRHPADFVLVIKRDLSEYGVGVFGLDPKYGGHIMDWLNEHYQIRETIGKGGFTGEIGDATLYRRRTETPQLPTLENSHTG